MAHTLEIKAKDKASKYGELIPQIETVVNHESNTIANLANTTAMLREVFGWFWIGFYLVDSDDELVLGPFQGTMACTRIKKGKGVCGTAWQNEQTILVDDVDQFDGHIACSSLSKSEIVVPIFAGREVVGVLDIDSDTYSTFDHVDKEHLELIAHIIGKMILRCGH